MHIHLVGCLTDSCKLFFEMVKLKSLFCRHKLIHKDEQKNVLKRKKTVMGLDPHTIPTTSPSKHACKPKLNPKHAPPKLSGVRCGMHSLSNSYSVCALFIWRCLLKMFPAVTTITSLTTLLRGPQKGGKNQSHQLIGSGVWKNAPDIHFPHLFTCFLRMSHALSCGNDKHRR